jgi:hypothetical protein
MCGVGISGEVFSREKFAEVAPRPESRNVLVGPIGVAIRNKRNAHPGRGLLGGCGEKATKIQKKCTQIA